MNKRSNNFPPALKHGAYSGITLLPGEDPTAFKKLHDGLVAEFAPVGPLEDDIVLTLARLMWRKQNLVTYCLAEHAKNRFSAIYAEFRPAVDLWADPRKSEESRAAYEAADEEVRRELGEAFQLVEMGKDVTVEHLFEELSVLDRLDSMIDRCIKRLLLVRGVKSMSLSSSITPAPSRKRRVA